MRALRSSGSTATGGARRRSRSSRSTADRSLVVPQPPSELIEALVSGDCVLFAGAGVSARAGLPTWRAFLRKLLAWSTKQKLVDRAGAASLRECLADDPGLVADGIMSRFNEGHVQQRGTETAVPSSALLSFLRSMFIRPNTRLTGVHQTLAALPFRAVLTTNFDNLLERTFHARSPKVYTHQDADALLAAMSKREFFVLKAYGGLDIESLLIAPAQYQTAIADNRLFATFMESLFVSKTLFFLGASLEGIDDYLFGLRFSGVIAREHYALVDVRGQAWRAKADALQRRYGIRVLPFMASARWPEMADFVRSVSHHVKDDVRARKKTAVRRPGLLIKRVELTNVGPFESLSLDLSEGWNVLLGDNGVGKSSILRAIAVGLCGAEAKPYAGRLIKSRESKATIVIETERGRYTTELFRTDAEAEMRLHGGSPLAIEGWLAVGFPALRTLSWNRKDLSERTVSRATPADLLPLVKGEPDARLDRLKTWLLDLDYRIQSRLGGGRYHRQRTKLFELVGELTPGLTLTFDSVDPSSREITVVTDDGPVPIEAISQGTSSLLGWVGVLLQRLADLHANRSDPWTEPALVLIDEIDAHMHPEWQQRLAATVKGLFPQVQLIATTHSPLIVPSLTQKQIVVLRRKDGRLVAERPPEDVRGFRTDQVLTSSLFRLETALSPEVQKALDDYTRLVIRDDLNERERQTLEASGDLLRTTLPSPEQHAHAREAAKLIREWTEERSRLVPRETREQMLQEANLQLQEMVTGSRRPV
jgi:ABC-type multidrug transport system ATPase subunit